MSAPPRGPRGTAGPPPSDLHRRTLPKHTLRPGLELCRIHRLGRAPVFFSPAKGEPPAGRFDSPTGAFRVLYAAETLEGAFVETVLRTPSRLLIGSDEIMSRAFTSLRLNRELRLIDLRAEGLQQLGLDTSIISGPYDPCGLWADAFFYHPDKPDGIWYPSRYDPSQACIALFDREPNTISPVKTHPLTDVQRLVGEILRRYGKAIG